MSGAFNSMNNVPGPILFLIMAVSGWYLHTLCPFLAPVIVYLLVAIAAFAGSYLLYEIMSRIPFIRWCVLGIKKEKKE